MAADLSNCIEGLLQIRAAWPLQPKTPNPKPKTLNACADMTGLLLGDISFDSTGESMAKRNWRKLRFRI